MLWCWHVCFFACFFLLGEGAYRVVFFLRCSPSDWRFSIVLVLAIYLHVNFSHTYMNIYVFFLKTWLSRSDTRVKIMKIFSFSMLNISLLFFEVLIEGGFSLLLDPYIHNCYYIFLFNGMDRVKSICFLYTLCMWKLARSNKDLQLPQLIILHLLFCLNICHFISRYLFPFQQLIKLTITKNSLEEKWKWGHNKKSPSLW